MRRNRGAPARGRIEVDLGIESGQCDSLIEDVGCLRSGHDVGRIRGAADRASRLQAAARALRQEAEIFAGHRKSQIGRAIDAAIEREAGAAEPQTDMFKGPRVTRVSESATAGSGDAPQPPAKSVDLHADRVAFLESAARHREPEIEA